jgi:hypothetical protein
MSREPRLKTFRFESFPVKAVRPAAGVYSAAGRIVNGQRSRASLPHCDY